MKNTKVIYSFLISALMVCFGSIEAMASSETIKPVLPEQEIPQMKVPPDKLQKINKPHLVFIRLLHTHV